ncbi:MAG: tyrosine-type recombinase/integrase [Acidobacteria bacterium]|nr:tyrosine-type recombinase/integrase [Acidobacteriota bacterium]
MRVRGRSCFRTGGTLINLSPRCKNPTYGRCKPSDIKSRFRLYDLRHTFGSRSVMAGVDLATVKELMGHSQISTTMRYVHPTPEHKRAAVEKLERFNVAQLMATYENQAGSPQIPPQHGCPPATKPAIRAETGVFMFASGLHSVLRPTATLGRDS